MSAALCLQRLAALERSLQAGAESDVVARELAALRQSIEGAADSAAVSQEEIGRLRDSASRWRSIVENPFDFVVLIDANACIQYVNHTFPGVKAEDLIGKTTVFDWTREEDHPVIREALDEVFMRGKPAYYEAYAPRVHTWFASILGPIVRHGKVEAASVLARDITQHKQAMLALRDSEERFRQLAENVDDVFFLLEPGAGGVLYTSPAYEKLWGRSRQDLLHDMGAWLQGVHPEDRDRVAAAFGDMIALFHGQQSGYRFGRDVDMRVLRPDGSVRWVRSRLFPIYDQHGGLRRVAGVVSDMTERKTTEIALAAAEERFRLLVETLPVIPYIAAPDEPRRTIYISPQIEAKLGFSQQEWMETPDLWAARIHPQDRERVLTQVHQFLQRGDSLRTRYRLLSRDGHELWFLDEAILARDAAGRNKSIQGVMLDVSEAEEARAERQRARALSSQLVQVQEAERSHLARELHDEIGQQLTSLHLMLQMVQECPGKQPPALADARELVGDLMTRVRDLSLELRPSLLDDLGLLPACLNMFERFTRQTGVAVQFDHQGLERRFEAALETAAYRVVQEALTNVARHAVIDEVRVLARCDGSRLDLAIADQGRGFDAGAVGGNHGGVAGMRERVALVGGTMSLDSVPGGGTYIAVRMPLDAASRTHSQSPPGGEP